MHIRLEGWAVSMEDSLSNEPQRRTPTWTGSSRKLGVVGVSHIFSAKLGSRKHSLEPGIVFPAVDYLGTRLR